MAQENIRKFLEKELKEILWLNGRLTGFADWEIDDLICDLKPSFEHSEYDVSGGDDFPYDEWYDDFSEDVIRPILEEMSHTTEA